MDNCVYLKSGEGAIFTAIEKNETKHYRSRLLDINENWAKK